MTQQYVLIRRPQFFAIVPASDPGPLDRVSVKDLDKRGKTELVTVVLSLKKLNAEDLGPEVQKMMGPFGKVRVVEKANQLLLANATDTAWQAPGLKGKGRTIAGVTCHIHGMRLMWLVAVDKTAKLPTKLDDEKVSQRDVMDALTKAPPRCKTSSKKASTISLAKSPTSTPMSSPSCAT